MSLLDDINSNFRDLIDLIKIHQENSWTIFNRMENTLSNLIHIYCSENDINLVHDNNESLSDNNNDRNQNNRNQNNRNQNNRNQNSRFRARTNTNTNLNTNRNRSSTARNRQNIRESFTAPRQPFTSRDAFNNIEPFTNLRDSISNDRESIYNLRNGIQNEPRFSGVFSNNRFVNPFMNTETIFNSNLSNMFTNLEPINLENLTPVVIRPTQNQIDRATELLSFSEIRQPANLSCPITQEVFLPNDQVRRIKYCGHLFSDSNLMTWFDNNVRCPLCRFDIRNYIPGQNMLPLNRLVTDVDNIEPNNDVPQINSPILIRRTISRDSTNSNLEDNTNSQLEPTNLVNDISNNENNIMQRMTDQMARQYIDNLVRADESFSNLLNDGLLDLEYSVYVPTSNSIYTYRTSNNNANGNIPNLFTPRDISNNL